jgi:hypothetical protein
MLPPGILASRMILSQAQALRREAKLEDLHIWEQKKIKQSKTGPTAYTYYMASW